MEHKAPEQKEQFGWNPRSIAQGLIPIEKINGSREEFYSLGQVLMVFGYIVLLRMNFNVIMLFRVQ